MIKFAKQQSTELRYEEAKGLVNNSEHRRNIAFLTYGYWLIRRLKGESDGASILALWRIVAWDPRGGIRNDFQLDVDGFIQAERKVILLLEDFTS